MIFSLFKTKPLVDEDSVTWLFDVYAWALANFDAHFFYQETTLVLPNNSHFPGRADSIDAMAQLILGQVATYAGVKHWPIEAVDADLCNLDQTPKIHLEGNIRTAVANSTDSQSVTTQGLPIPYNPHQVNQPEGLIATYAHVLAHYLGQMAPQKPPGPAALWPQTTEVLAVYLGFGIMFANSAFTFRGGCGSCYNPQANRSAYLSELQSTYALAIFAVIKEIPPQQVTPHLKKYLRGSFKQMVKDIDARQIDTQRLLAYRTAPDAPR